MPFGSPSGAGRSLPSPPPGTTPAPIEDAVTSAACGGPVGLTRFGLGGGRSCCSLLPTQSSEYHVRSCRATRDRVGSSAAGRQYRANGGQQAVVSESHPSGESGDTGRRRSGGSESLPRTTMVRQLALARGSLPGQQWLGNLPRRRCPPRSARRPGRSAWPTRAGQSDQNQDLEGLV